MRCDCFQDPCHPQECLQAVTSSHGPPAARAHREAVEWGRGRLAFAGGSTRGCSGAQRIMTQLGCRRTGPLMNRGSPLPPADGGDSRYPQPWSAWREGSSPGGSGRDADRDTTWRRRVGGATPSDADADGAHPPIRYWQAMEGDRRGVEDRGTGTPGDWRRAHGDPKRSWKRQTQPRGA